MLTTTSIHNFKYSITDSTVSIPAGVARIGSKLLSYNGGQMTFDAMLAPGGDSSRYSNSILFLTPVGTSNTLDMTSVRSASVASPSSLVNPELPATAYPVGLFTIFSGDGTHFTRIESSIAPAGSVGGTQSVTGDITGTSLQVTGGIAGNSLNVQTDATVLNKMVVGDTAYVSIESNRITAPNGFDFHIGSETGAGDVATDFKVDGVTQLTIKRDGVTMESDATVAQNFMLLNIPTSDPGIPGAVYRVGSNLFISI